MKNHSDIKRLLLAEQYRSEYIIAVIRFLIYLALILEIFSNYLAVEFLPRGWERPRFMNPFWIGLFLSLLQYLDLQLFRKTRFYKFFSNLTKYLVITVDIGMLTFICYVLMRDTVFLNYFDFRSPWIFAFVFFVAGAIILIVNTFRHSPFSCYYAGILLVGSYLFLLSTLIGYQALKRLYLFTQEYAPASYLCLVSLALLVILSSSLSGRTHRIIVKSKKQEQLQRFLPQAIARNFLKSNQELNLAGKKEKVCILFSDIRNFTAFAERNEPEEVIEFLNLYLNDMIEVIFQNGGSLDKILGDGIMAVYGFPTPSPEDADNAVKSAIGMQLKLAGLNQTRRQNKQPPIEMGIGIHTGEVIMGSVGTERRMDFTAIGDVVNTASRLETLTKTARCSIIISRSTRDALRDEYGLKRLGMAALRGKSKKLEVFQVPIDHMTYHMVNLMAKGS